MLFDLVFSFTNLKHRGSTAIVVHQRTLSCSAKWLRSNYVREKMDQKVRVEPSGCAATLPLSFGIKNFRPVSKVPPSDTKAVSCDFCRPERLKRSKSRRDSRSASTWVHSVDLPDLTRFANEVECQQRHESKLPCVAHWPPISHPGCTRHHGLHINIGFESRIAAAWSAG